MVPIVLPRSITWSFSRRRLILGREMLTLQGHTPTGEQLDAFEESHFSNLAGNALPDCKSFVKQQQSQIVNSKSQKNLLSKSQDVWVHESMTHASWRLRPMPMTWFFVVPTPHFLSSWFLTEFCWQCALRSDPGSSVILAAGVSFGGRRARRYRKHGRKSHPTFTLNVMSPERVWIRMFKTIMVQIH